jgi:hypothetical protein
MRQVRRSLREEAARPVDMPAEVQARLDSALMRAAAERAGTIVPLHEAKETGERAEVRRVPRWLTIAAGLVVIGGTATAATQLIGTGGGDTAISGSATNDASGGAPPTSIRALATGTDYEPDKLGAQVDALLAPRLSAEQAPAQKQELDGGGGLADPAALHGCLTALGAGNATPLAVDIAAWQGKDAAVIVLPGTESSSVQVWVVGRGCAPGDDQLIHYQRVPRS